MQNHKDLDVWQQSVDLAQRTYEITKTFPKEELYGLVSQMRRCSVSVASNIKKNRVRKYSGIRGFAVKNHKNPNDATWPNTHTNH